MEIQKREKQATTPKTNEIADPKPGENGDRCPTERYYRPGPYLNFHVSSIFSQEIDGPTNSTCCRQQALSQYSSCKVFKMTKNVWKCGYFALAKPFPGMPFTTPDTSNPRHVKPLTH